MSPPRLSDLRDCFEGLLPSTIATCSRDGIPNVTEVSHVHYLDERHVALSRQFFNKTRKNIEENPYCSVGVLDPATLDAYQLRLRYLRSEHEGPLFEHMRARIDAIAAHTGMSHVFRLLCAEVYEVLAIEPMPGFHGTSAPITTEGRGGPRASDLLALQRISELTTTVDDLETLLDEVLAAMESGFGFRHAMVLVPDESGARLTAVASRGYPRAALGAEVRIGEGLIGTVAAERSTVRVLDLDQQMRYGRAVRHEMVATGDGAGLGPEVPLPGLSDARSVAALALTVRDELVGVLAVESREPLEFDVWHEAVLRIIGNHVALGIQGAVGRAAIPGPASPLPPRPAPRPDRPRHQLCFYTLDESVFLDGAYLIRNIPARILWKLLGWYQGAGRTEFTNRELRMDPTLGLPPVKDNLETRLILLKNRLAERCPDIRMTRTGRGRFALCVDCDLVLDERAAP